MGKGVGRVTVICPNVLSTLSARVPLYPQISEPLKRARVHVAGSLDPEVQKTLIVSPGCTLVGTRKETAEAAVTIEKEAAALLLKLVRRVKLHVQSSLTRRRTS